MAKRGKSRKSEDDSDGEIDPMMFVQQQGDQTGQLGLLLKMLGMDDNQDLERGKLGLGREELEQRLGLTKSAQDIEERKLKAEEKRAGEAEAYRTWEKQQKAIDRDEERKYKQQQLESEEQKSKDTLNKELLPYITDEKQREVMMSEMSPQAKAGYAKLAALQQEQTAKNMAPQLEAAYKKGDWNTVKQLAGTLSPETMARPEFDWQKWNQGVGVKPLAAAGDITGGSGLLGMLWNAPGALLNLERGALEGGAKALTGRDVKFGRVKYTDPLTREIPNLIPTPTLPNPAATASRFIQSQLPAGAAQAGAMLQPNPLSSGPPAELGPKLEHLIQIAAPTTNAMVPSSEVYGGFPRPAVEERVASPGMTTDDLLRMIQEERERNLSATRMGP